MTGRTDVGQRDVRRLNQGRALWLSTLAFAISFAVWTIFAIIGIRIKAELGLNETLFGLLVGLPIAVGSLIRVPVAIWSEKYGSRVVYSLVMLGGALGAWLLTFAGSYPTILLAGVAVGIAGGSFGVGVTYLSKWY